MHPFIARLRSVAALALLLLAACAGSDSPQDLAGGGSTVTVEDSAGIAIVRIPLVVLEALPVRYVASEPALMIGEVEGREEELFGYVTDATQLPDGGIAIIDVMQERIVVFDSLGDFRNTVGGPGNGPGEFGSVFKFGPIGDTLYVRNGARGISTFLSDGTFLAERQIAGAFEGTYDGEYLRPYRWMEPYAGRVGAVIEEWRSRESSWWREVEEGTGALRFRACPGTLRYARWQDDRHHPERTRKLRTASTRGSAHVP